MMSDASRAMVLASFLGDSLALGAHWIYNTKDIAQRFGRVDRLLAPQPDSFHAPKGAGEFTHYGDQTLVLLRVLAQSRGFDLQAFSRAWQDFFAAYSGYFDRATKNTLIGYKKGLGPEEAGSSSNDLAGAGVTTWPVQAGSPRWSACFRTERTNWFPQPGPRPP